MAARRQSRSRARAAVVPLPRGSRGGLARIGRLLPSATSLLAGFALVALAAGAYAAARSTSLFAIERIEVRGASPPAAAPVRRALAPLLGENLVTLDPDAVAGLVADLPMVAATTYDRSFPHTLVVTVRLEQPVAVVRRGRESWLVSVRGRVLRRLQHGERPTLARVWVPASAPLAAGGYIGDPAAERAVRVLAAVRRDRLPLAVRSVRGDRGELALRLTSGLELQLGSETDLRLKLAVAARIVRTLEPAWDGGPAYLDVSVPERPVAGGNSQLEGRG